MKTVSIPCQIGERRITNTGFTHVYIISDAAAMEKQRNWQEVRGYGYGDATVSHPDWAAIYAQEKAADPSQRCFNICCSTIDGKHGHAGCIYERYDGKGLQISG